MTDTNARRTALAIALVAGITAIAPAAAADDREQCASAAEQAQSLKDEGKYRRAREQTLMCARDVCPTVIKSDCSKWLDEIEREAPTVTFGAEESGKDLTDVKVSMDGVVLTERLDGKPQVVDAGEHTFLFEHGGDRKTEKVLVRAGEKGRPIIVAFGPQASTAPPPSADREGSLAPVIAVGAIGLIGIGSFAYFGISGKNQVDDLQSCKPHCAESDVDKARTKLIIADISLGVGVVALVIAGVMYFTRSSSAEAKAKTTGLLFDVAPTRGGAAAALGASF